MLELTLKNYRRFLQSNTLSFPPGLTIITGPNGAGKSTLCEAIAYALFARKSRADIRSDNAIDSAEVFCRLTVGHQILDVHRVGAMAELHVDGTLLVPLQPGSMEVVTQRLRELLGGLTQEQFEQIYMAEQGDTAGLLSKGEEFRKRLLQKALDMDVIEEALSLQGKERELQLNKVLTVGVRLAEKIGLAETDRKLLDQLVRAQTEGNRRRYLNLFLNACGKEVEELKCAVQKTRSDVDEARRHQELAQKALVEKKQTEDKHREVVKDWEWRQQQYKENEDQLAQAMRMVEEAAQELEERNQGVAQAQACADAVARIQITQAAYKRLHESSQVLPLAMDRWQGVKDAVGEVVKARREFACLEATPNQLGVALEKAERASERLRALDMDPTAHARHQLAENRGKLQQQIDDNQAAIKALDTELGDARCPTCNNPLDEHQRTERVAHLQSWLEVELPPLQAHLIEEDEALTQQQLAWKSARQQAEIDARQADRNVDAAKRHLLDLQQSREQLAQAKKRLCEKLAQWRSCGNKALWGYEHELIDTCEKMERRIAALEQRAAGYRELSRLKSEQEHAEQNYFSRKALVKSLEIKRSDLAYDVELHQQADKALQEVQNERERSEEALLTAEKQVWATENASKTAETLATSADPLFEEVNRLAFSYLREEQLFKLLKDFSDRYFGQNIRAIEERANTLILQAVRDGSIQGIRLGDRQLQYLDGSYIPQDTSRLSGGEKALVGLCLRIAVAEQALAIAQKARPRFLILDEVLSSLDEERLEQMQQVFSEVTQRGLFEHIIMITHLESIKQNWQGTRLSVIKDNSASSSTAAFIKNSDMSLSEVIDTLERGAEENTSG